MKYCWDNANLLFSALWAWFTNPTKNNSSNLKETLIFIYTKRSSWSFTFFLRYYNLKNPAIWFAKSIMAHNLRTRILPGKGLQWSINKNIIFHIRLIPGQTNAKSFQKMQKNYFWAHFRPVLSSFGQNRIFFKILFSLVFFILSIIVPNFKRD